MYSISAITSISHQQSFQNEGFTEGMLELNDSHTLITPDFKQFIDASLLRRMSKVLRMSVACAKHCMELAKLEQPDAIIVGTGLGCLVDTEKFLNNGISLAGLLPPTAFIQSTHNTIAGQISLSIGNHGYNMTHTQNVVSFEHAMLDAMLLLGEGSGQVLVGAADETIPFLEEVAAELIPDCGSKLTSGSTFLILKNLSDLPGIVLVAVEIYTNYQSKWEVIKTFLLGNGLDLTDIEVVATAQNLESENLELLQSGVESISYLNFTGVYATASALGFHILVDKLIANPKPRYALLINDVAEAHLGLTLLKKREA